MKAPGSPGKAVTPRGEQKEERQETQYSKMEIENKTDDVKEGRGNERKAGKGCDLKWRGSLKHRLQPNVEANEKNGLTLWCVGNYVQL